MKGLVAALMLLFAQSIPQGALPYSLATGPFLTCSNVGATGATSSNLTTAGTIDWIQWNQVATTERKATGGSVISTYSFVPTSFTPANSTTQLRTLSWTDGTPDATGSVTSGVLNQRNAVNQGFSFTCPADTTTHVCIAYVQAHTGPATLVAHLSDSSATDYSFGTGTGFSDKTYVFTCNYKAGSGSQTLKYTWTSNLSGSPGVFIGGAAYQ